MLFNPKENESAKDAINHHQVMLMAAHFNTVGYKSVVAGNDSDGLLSEHDIFVLKMKSLYLYTALQNATEKMNSVTWKNCCEWAIANLAHVGIKFRSRANSAAGPTW